MKKVNFREFNKAMAEANKELRKISNELFNEDSWESNVEIMEAPTWGQEDAEIKMQINWRAIGSVDTDKALAMATLLQKAAEMVENFVYNGYVIEY